MQFPTNENAHVRATLRHFTLAFLPTLYPFLSCQLRIDSPLLSSSSSPFLLLPPPSSFSLLLLLLSLIAWANIDFPHSALNSCRVITGYYCSGTNEAICVSNLTREREREEKMENRKKGTMGQIIQNKSIGESRNEGWSLLFFGNCPLLQYQNWVQLIGVWMTFYRASLPSFFPSFLAGQSIGSERPVPSREATIPDQFGTRRRFQLGNSQRDSAESSFHTFFRDLN